MTDRPHNGAGQSRVTLMGDVVAGFARLVRGEFALASAEAKRSLGDASAALAKLVIAAILGITAVNVLSGAAVAGLVLAGLAPIWASLAVGAALLLAAYIFVRVGLAHLKPANLAPKRMMANLRQDAQTLKSLVIPDATSNNRP